MAAAKETAEEQLLRMIEGPAGTPPARPRRFSLVAVASNLRFAFASLAERLSRLAERSQRTTDPLLSRLRLVVSILWLTLGSLGLFFVIDLVVLRPEPPSAVIISPGGIEDVGESTRAFDTLKPLAAYIEKIGGRNPFALTPQQRIESGELTAMDRLQERTATLIVVGMSRGSVPEALIEDTELKRTHFVTIGDEINGVRVIAISPKGVTVVYENEELLLK